MCIFFLVNGILHYFFSVFQSKVVRVLNLWQKNGVFMSEIIQPLLDMASDPNNKQHSIAGMLYKTNQLKEEPFE